MSRNKWSNHFPHVHSLPSVPRSQDKEASAIAIGLEAMGLTGSVAPAECEVTPISGGITNVLFRVTFPAACGVTPVLIRRFGAEGMIDRRVENSLFAALAMALAAEPWSVADAPEARRDVLLPPDAQRLARDGQEHAQLLRVGGRLDGRRDVDAAHGALDGGGEAAHGRALVRLGDGLRVDGHAHEQVLRPVGGRALAALRRLGGPEDSVPQPQGCRTQRPCPCISVVDQ